MSRLLRSRLVVLATVLIAGALVSGFARPQDPRTPLKTSQPQGLTATSWWKGNLHSHTLNSDGDSTPDDVVRWYREHGYHFATITDHNYLTSVDGLNALHGADGKFLVVRGEEVTDRFGDKPVHVNGFNPSAFIKPPGGSSVLTMLQNMIDAIREANAVPSINHPNFGWAITPDELAQVQRTRLFEVFNGHPTVNNVGGGGVPGLEETWDRLLSNGKLLYGIAVDDAHVFKRPEDVTAPRPGGGWVHVRAPRLEAGAIVQALERGDFYSSTGVELQSLEVTAASMTIAIKTAQSSKYRVQFIGREGKVLSEAVASPATYTFRGDEGYVRAKVIESNGKVAWIQPVPVGAGSPR
jgi:hypothetical protein